MGRKAKYKTEKEGEMSKLKTKYFQMPLTIYESLSYNVRKEILSKLVDCGHTSAAEQINKFTWRGKMKCDRCWRVVNENDIFRFGDSNQNIEHLCPECADLKAKFYMFPKKK